MMGTGRKRERWEKGERGRGRERKSEIPLSNSLGKPLLETVHCPRHLERWHLDEKPTVTAPNVITTSIDLIPRA